MSKKIILSFLGFFISLTCFSQKYIKDVTVIDVINQQLVAGQTVLLDNDLISAIKPATETEIPPGVKVINGTGKFLIPGLTDAHVHFFQSGGLYTRPDAIDLRKYKSFESEITWVKENMDDLMKRYLQAGITTVVDVGSTYNFLDLRKSMSEKHSLPKLYMTGPLFTTWIPTPFKDLGNDRPFELPTNPYEARKLVQKQLTYGTDFIKIWYIVDTKNVEGSARKYLPIVKAIIDEAHKNKLKVAVHATERITAQLAVESGCDFLVHSVEDEMISDDFARLLKEKGTILSPTLIVSGGYSNTFGQKNNFSVYELSKSNPQQIGSLDDLKHLTDFPRAEGMKAYINSDDYIAQKAKAEAILRHNLKKLADHGVIIAAGTDAGNIGTQHGTSLLGELKAMQESGLTSWQVLQSATINAAKIFDKESSTGSISVGKDANLVLLNANPLSNLENLTDIAFVFHKGTVINPDTLIKETPVALVQRQLNAYNARNIDAFLEPYADDIELYTYPDKLLLKGKDAMRVQYGAMFKNMPDLHGEIEERTVQGNVVTDKEIVSGMGDEKVKATAIYHIVGDKIGKVYFRQ